MKIIVKEDYEEMSLFAAEVVIDAVKQNPQAVISFPTGSTPLRMYELLITACQNNEVDFSQIKVRSVDEYVGLAADHDQSYAYFLWDNLLGKINVNPANVVLLDGCAPNPKQACLEYQKLIRDGNGIDLYIDGVGANGHIGFNEPDDALALSYHVQDISRDTRAANARFFTCLEEVPKQALSIGIYDILTARKSLFLSNGSHKAEAWKRYSESDYITPAFPLSFLHLAENALAIIDKASAAEIIEQ